MQLRLCGEEVLVIVAFSLMAALTTVSDQQMLQ